MECDWHPRCCRHVHSTQLRRARSTRYEVLHTFTFTKSGRWRKQKPVIALVAHTWRSRETLVDLAQLGELHLAIDLRDEPTLRV